MTDTEAKNDTLIQLVHQGVAGNAELELFHADSAVRIKVSRLQPPVHGIL